MEVEATKASQERSVCLLKAFKMKSNKLELTNFKRTILFWDKIHNNDPREEILCFEYHDHVEQHNEFYEECIAFDNWTPHSFKHMNKERPQTRQNFDPTHFEIPITGRWTATPTKESFPKIHQYFQERKDIYSRPLIQKLDPDGVIGVHNHGDTIPYGYNMSINFPEGVRFAFYPQGLISFKAGDVYKLYVKNDHSVLNHSNMDRYHIFFQPSNLVLESESG